jgi:hypothetical protein
MSKKKNTHSILIANEYLIKCQLIKGFGSQETAFEQLTKKINQALSEKEFNSKQKETDFKSY